MPVQTSQSSKWRNGLLLRPKSPGRWIFAGVLLSILLVQCSKRDSALYRYPVVKGPQALFRISPKVSSSLYGVDSGRWASVPMKPGEVLYSMGDDANYFFRNDTSLPDSLAFTIRDSVVVLLNGRPFALQLEADGNVLGVLRSMRSADMKSLQCIRFTGDIREQYLPWLDSLSRLNPKIDLHLEPDSTQISLKHLTWLADHFRPRFLVTELSTEDLQVLTRFQTLESLYLSLNTDSSGRQALLPALPSLRQLTIDADSDSSFYWDNFFTKNPQLESLSIPAEVAGALNTANRPNRLRALYLTGEDSVRGLPDGASWTACRVLSIENPLAANFPVERITAYDQLEELGLPASLSQEQFNAILSANRHLRSLSVYAQDTLIAKDYTSLRHMKALRVLQITGKHGSVETLKALKRLEFLSLPEEFFKDSVALASLQQALPDTRITPNGGFCMGSGRILLLWPLVICFLLALKLRKPVKAVS